VVAFSAGVDGGSAPREHDDLERWCGGRALPWHRADLGFFGAHALSRCARVARMDSCGPLLATHFLLEKQVEARRSLDHLIGELLQMQTNVEAKCLCGLEVDHQFGTCAHVREHDPDLLARRTEATVMRSTLQGAA
jgi:hypothetical protein